MVFSIFRRKKTPPEVQRYVDEVTAAFIGASRTVNAGLDALIFAKQQDMSDDVTRIATGLVAAVEKGQAKLSQIEVPPQAIEAQRILESGMQRQVEGMKLVQAGVEQDDESLLREGIDKISSSASSLEEANKMLAP